MARTQRGQDRRIQVEPRKQKSNEFDEGTVRSRCKARSASRNGIAWKEEACEGKGIPNDPEDQSERNQERRRGLESPRRRRQGGRLVLWNHGLPDVIQP